MRQSEILNIHRELLAKWRNAMDLIGPGDMEAHFIDAISAVETLNIKGKWIDLGSGAGFPGIALAAYHPNIELTMVESRQKRAIFLKKIVMQAKLSNVTVLCTRTERIQDSFDGCISRAYKPPLEFLKDAQRLVRTNGIAISLLGSMGDFILPPEWSLEEKYIYSVPDGTRQRWNLRLGSSSDS